MYLLALAYGLALKVQSADMLRRKVIRAYDIGAILIHLCMLIWIISMLPSLP